MLLCWQWICCWRSRYLADPQLAFWVLLLTIFTIMALGLKMGGDGLEWGGGGVAALLAELFLEPQHVSVDVGFL